MILTKVSQPLLIVIVVAVVNFRLIQTIEIFFLKIQTLNKPEMVILEQSLLIFHTILEYPDFFYLNFYLVFFYIESL